MNKRERDDFYLSKPNDLDDGDDYELEPPDAEVIAAEERRTKEFIEASRTAIDIDEIYRDADRQRGDEILQNWFRGFKGGFRFQVKHLLIATAVLAIVLTLAKLQMLGTTVVMLVMLSVGGLYLWLQWQENKAQEEATRRRHEMYERRRAAMQANLGGAVQKPSEPLPNETDVIWQEAVSREPFRFHFSMAQMMVTITVAAVIFGLVQFLGGPSNTATILGFAALIGLVVHALGFEPPGIVVLGWWLILVLYVALSIFAAVMTGIT